MTHLLCVCFATTLVRLENWVPPEVKRTTATKRSIKLQ